MVCVYLGLRRAEDRCADMYRKSVWNGSFLHWCPGGASGEATEVGDGAVGLYYFFSSKNNVLIFVNPDNSKILKQKDFVLLVLRELER